MWRPPLDEPRDSTGGHPTGKRRNIGVRVAQTQAPEAMHDRALVRGPREKAAETREQADAGEGDENGEGIHALLQSRCTGSAAERGHANKNSETSHLLCEGLACSKEPDRTVRVSAQ